MSANLGLRFNIFGLGTHILVRLLSLMDSIGENMYGKFTVLDPGRLLFSVTHVFVIYKLNSFRVFKTEACFGSRSFEITFPKFIINATIVVGGISNASFSYLRI